MFGVNSLTCLIHEEYGRLRVHYITNALLLNQHTKEIVICNSNVLTYFPVYVCVCVCVCIYIYIYIYNVEDLRKITDISHNTLTT